MEIIDRKTAHARGMHKYWTGEPCQSGHVNFRYVKTGGCVSCVAQSKRQFAKGDQFHVRYSIVLFTSRDYPKLKAYVDALNMQSEWENEVAVQRMLKEHAEKIKAMETLSSVDHL